MPLESRLLHIVYLEPKRTTTYCSVGGLARCMLVNTLEQIFYLTFKDTEYSVSRDTEDSTYTTHDCLFPVLCVCAIVKPIG